MNFTAKFHKISKNAKFRCAPLCLWRFLIRVLRAKSLNSRRTSRPFLDARSVNLRAELFVSARFRSVIYEPDLRQSVLSHSIPPRAFTLFSRFFLHLSAPIFDFFPRAPCVKFCCFARSIRSGYERTCTQTPSLRVLFTRRCARILSKFYVEFQDCLHLHSRRGHKRSLLRARKRDLRDTAREMKFRRCLVKAHLSRRSAPQNFKTATSRDLNLSAGVRHSVPICALRKF